MNCNTDFSGIFRSRAADIRGFALRAGFGGNEMQIIERETALAAADDELSALFGESLVQRKTSQEIRILALKNPLYNLLFLLAACSDVHEMYKKNTWTEEMFDGVLRDIRIWSEHCLANELVFGISSGLCGELDWLKAECEGGVVRFGRLQCNTSCVFPDERMILGRKNDPSWIVVMRQDFDLNERGLIALDGEHAAAHCRPMEETDDLFRGCAVRRDGSIDPVFRDFPKSEWEVLAKPGDFAINLHIPADGPLSPEECRKSLERMIGFFRNSGRDPKAFICHSWILDPQFAELLPEKSNLNAFQRLGQISTTPGVSEAWRRVFGFRLTPETASHLPCPTGMQKAFLRFVQNGGVFRNGSLSLPVR